jgi:hypothetical protein
MSGGREGLRAPQSSDNLWGIGMATVFIYYDHYRQTFLQKYSQAEDIYYQSYCINRVGIPVDANAILYATKTTMGRKVKQATYWWSGLVVG